MRQVFLPTVAISCFLGLGFGMASTASAYDVSNDGLPHLELEMTGAEYRPLVEPLLANKADDPLAVVMDAGKRNLDWLELINRSRSDANKLQLSTPATQTGIPIEQASSSNREIVMQSWNEEIALLPAEMKQVIVDGGAGVATPAVDDATFLQHARIVDRIYQRASRWLLQEPHLEGYAARSVMDIRGFYFLSKEADLEQKLRGWETLAVGDQTRLKGYLVGLCHNSEAEVAECQERFDRSVTREHNAWVFYQSNLAAGQEMWDGFFAIPMHRTDVTWAAANANEFRIPFRDPHREDVVNWLRDNIQDEWKFGDWRLILDFQPTGNDNMTHVVFQEGATPHVNRIAGSEITMDGNRNLQEYSSRWTIRHEYGHVLGFPDCYVEFYDEEAGAMVNYQLDITNLMCSRRGSLQAKHFDELKRIYFQPN